MSITRRVPYLPGKTKETPEGGHAVRYINKTGAPSVKGTLVKPSSSTPDGVVLTSNSGDFDPIGVIYNSGVPDGSYVWVVTGGKCDVLLTDGDSASLEDFVNTSTTQAGRATTSAIPDGQSFAAVNNHFREIGHAMQAVSSGTNVLCRITAHFN